MNFRVVALGIGTISWLSCSAAADLCTVAPSNCKVLKEDAKVRVLEFNARKGDKTPMHSHPAYVVYIVKAGKSRFTLADGTTFERNPKDGEAFIVSPVTHSEDAWRTSSQFWSSSKSRQGQSRSQSLIGEVTSSSPSPARCSWQVPRRNPTIQIGFLYQRQVRYRGI